MGHITNLLTMYQNLINELFFNSLPQFLALVLNAYLYLIIVIIKL